MLYLSYSVQENLAGYMVVYGVVRKFCGFEVGECFSCGVRGCKSRREDGLPRLLHSRLKYMLNILNLNTLKDKKYISYQYMQCMSECFCLLLYIYTRSLGALRALTSSWSSFGPLDAHVHDAY